MGRTASGGTMQAMLHDIRLTLIAPSRTPRMAVVFGRLLAIAFLLCFGTGLYSHFIQEPLSWMTFPTRPIWLYQVSQGIHITAGIACFPLIFAKLYTVFPALFQSPPVRSVRHAIERGSIALFVAASLVEITIGLLNTFQLYAIFPFPFRQTHFALSFVVVGSLAIHIGLKLQVISKNWTKRRADVAASLDADRGDGPFDELRDRELRDRGDGPFDELRDREPRDRGDGPFDELRDRELADRGDGPFDELRDRDRERVQSSGVTGRIFRWIDRDPAAATPSSASRRGFFATVAIAVGTLVALTAGQSFRPLDGANIFGPRKMGVGPQSLPVNRTAKAAKVTDTAVAADWVLTVVAGDRTSAFTRADLEAMPQVVVELPIACVEGWSQYATWTGVRMRDLIAEVGAGTDASVTATSLEQKSPYAVSTMGPEWVRDDLTLVALQLNGEVLDLDHGYPARLISPARPGVLQTKWLSRLEVNV